MLASEDDTDHEEAEAIGDADAGRDKEDDDDDDESSAMLGGVGPNKGRKDNFPTPAALLNILDDLMECKSTASKFPSFQFNGTLVTSPVTITGQTFPNPLSPSHSTLHPSKNSKFLFTLGQTFQDWCLSNPTSCIHHLFAFIGETGRGLGLRLYIGLVDFLRQHKSILANLHSFSFIAFQDFNVVKTTIDIFREVTDCQWTFKTYDLHYGDEKEKEKVESNHKVQEIAYHLNLSLFDLYKCRFVL